MSQRAESPYLTFHLLKFWPVSGCVAAGGGASRRCGPAAVCGVAADCTGVGEWDGGWSPVDGAPSRPDHCADSRHAGTAGAR